MAEYKRHLSVRHRGVRFAACGKPDVQFLTDTPSRVTCGGCQRTLAMADREVQSQVKSKRKSRRERQ